MSPIFLTQRAPHIGYAAGQPLDVAVSHALESGCPACLLYEYCNVLVYDPERGRGLTCTGLLNMASLTAPT